MDLLYSTLSGDTEAKFIGEILSVLTSFCYAVVQKAVNVSPATNGSRVVGWKWLYLIITRITISVVQFGGRLSTLIGKRTFDRPLLVIDVETTGSDLRIHQILELGAVLLDCRTLEEACSFSTLVRPEPGAFERADSHALSIHGLTIDRFEGAPSSAQVISQFLRTFGTNFYFCGWNICFDTQFLAALFQQAGRYQDFEAFSYHKLDLWSLLEFAWLQGVIQNPPDSLSEVCKMFEIPRRHLHEALEDARISAKVLHKILSLIKGVE